LVERLVRNEKARGSNPLTSSLRSQSWTRAKDCTAEGLAKAAFVDFVNANAASYDSASQSIIRAARKNDCRERFRV
jgi:hypothetical protein